jgi:hypothetical protein
MSDCCAIDMHHFVEALRASIPDAIHPSPQAICNERCHEMHLAVQDNDTTELLRLMGVFRAKIADELRWEADKLDSIGLRELADEIAALRAQADAVAAGTGPCHV